MKKRARCNIVRKSAEATISSFKWTCVSERAHHQARLLLPSLDTNKWNLALRPAETLLQCLGQLILEAGDELCLQQEQAGNKHPWGIEAATALANSIAGFARDIWMGSAPSPPLHSHTGPNLQAAVLFDLPQETRDLVQQLLRHTSNSATLNSCFKLLRDPAPQPLPRLSLGNRILSEYESNQEWVSALHSQCSWPDPFDERLHALVLSRCRQLCASTTLQDRTDARNKAVTEQEVVCVRENWASSRGMPPDLLPRALFQAASAGWNLVVWGLQRWAGPGGAAYRPHLWRKSALCPVHKTGPANLAASFRLIFVKTQLGLMQEALLAQCWLSTVRNHIQPCQSGYIRSIDDAHLLLHEACAEAMFQHRPLWFVMGDFHFRRLSLAFAVRTFFSL